VANASNETVIGPRIVVRGHLKAAENVAIRGRVVGHIEDTADVRIEVGAVVDASVNALNLDVHGTVNGDVVVTDCITIHPGGRLTGHVMAPRVVLLDGAYVKGHIDTDDQRQEVIDAILNDLSSRAGSVLELGGDPKWGGSSAGLIEHAGQPWRKPRK